MNIFLSWSGARSHAVAELLKDWLSSVIQASRPWISSQDIDKGSLWFDDINDRLRETSTGIVCLTQENKNQPWILFEAGALAKGLTKARVCTLLIDLEPKDVQPPLSQFNHTLPDEAGMKALVSTLNKGLGENALSERALENAFEAHWPRFKKDFAKALHDHKGDTKAKGRSPEEVMNEILENTRQLLSKPKPEPLVVLSKKNTFGQNPKFSNLDTDISWSDTHWTRPQAELEKVIADWAYEYFFKKELPSTPSAPSTPST